MIYTMVTNPTSIYMEHWLCARPWRYRSKQSRQKFLCSGEIDNEQASKICIVSDGDSGDMLMWKHVFSFVPYCHQNDLYSCFVLKPGSSQSSCVPYCCVSLVSFNLEQLFLSFLFIMVIWLSLCLLWSSPARAVPQANPLPIPLFCF